MAKPDPIRVMVVDDHSQVRNGLSVFLDTQDDMVLVGQAVNGAEAIRICAEARPHVVLMDLVMPEMDGVAATRVICRAHPDVKVIALTSFGDQGLVQEALQAGAIGYLLKNASIDEIAAAVRAAIPDRPTIN